METPHDLSSNPFQFLTALTVKKKERMKKVHAEFPVFQLIAETQVCKKRQKGTSNMFRD